MEEKKGSKNGLLIILLIFAIVVIGAMGYLVYQLNEDKEKANEQVSKLDSQINDLEDMVKTLKEEINNNQSENTSTKSDAKSEVKNSKIKITDTSDIESMLKKSHDYEYLQIKEIKEESGKYLVKADYYVPAPISEKEYNEMVNNKKITLRNKEYIFEDNDDIYNPGYGYVYISGQAPEMGYWIEKEDDGYIFIHEIGGVYDIINEIKDEYNFYLDKDIKVTEVAGDIEDEELEKFLSRDENKDINDFLVKLVCFESENDDAELIVVVDKR